MATSYAIRRLYENVLNYELAVNDVSLRDVKSGVQSMAYVYAPCSSDFQSGETKFANFNDPACRCAYLHKYAPLHTHVVQDAMMRIFKEVPNHFRNLLLDGDRFRICSLGGGPGTDVVGVITALLFAFGPFHSSVTIVDCMKKWEDTVALIMHELTVRPLPSNTSNNTWSYNNNCQWNYLECNLLCSMTNEVNKSIAAASMVTMVKFVSAAICTDTEKMVDKIFRVVKPGALVLFIDNAAGGFSQIIERSGKRNGLVPIFGPLRHVEYEEEALKRERFGYTSCFKTRVTIILLQKLPNRQNGGNPQISNRNVAFPKSADPVRPSQATGRTPTFGMAPKPVSNTATGRNEIDINWKTNPNPVFPSAISSVTNLPSFYLQKPSAAATARTKSNSAEPEVEFSSVDQCQKPLMDSDESSPSDCPDLSFGKTRPTAVVPPKFSTSYPYPSIKSSWQSIPEPSSIVRTSRPVAGERSQRSQTPREVGDGFEETCCSCCSIS